MLVNAVKSAIILLCVLLLSSCLDLMGALKSNESEEIQTPSNADVSPKMDFNRIGAIAVFPIFPGGAPTQVAYGTTNSIQDQAFAEQVSHTFASELTAKQSQWKVHGYKDVVDAISKHDLGRGYKNFQADYNTSSGQMHAFVLTGETKQFLSRLAAVMKVDAFVFGSYDLSYGQEYVQTILGVQVQKVYKSGVSTVLFYAKNQEMWWRATHRVTGRDKERLVSAISKSLAAHVGKGTLRQL